MGRKHWEERQALFCGLSKMIAVPTDSRQTNIGRWSGLLPLLLRLLLYETENARFLIECSTLTAAPFSLPAFNHMLV